MNEPGHVIVLGNEKGGTGKSTVAMHVIVSLLERGLTVGSIDLDARQATLSRYIDNRRIYAGKHDLALKLPMHEAVLPAGQDKGDEARQQDVARLESVIAELRQACNVVVIDTPGSDHYLSRVGHSHADTLLTPLNDSLVDLDVLAKVDPETLRIRSPSHYAEMVWDIKKRKALRDGGSMQWIVSRNRLSHLDARNKRDMDKLLSDLAKRVGFRLVAGLGERVVYREMFLKGLTLLDMRQEGTGLTLSMSHVAARQELRTLVDAIELGRPGQSGEG